jgi:hypothetical protein
MRREAWEAAVRYTAISLTDRSLGVWRLLNPDGLKFTIHSKVGEIRFVPTTSEFLSMTAQHCVGGIKRSPRGSRLTFVCRLERESCNEYPVTLRNDTAAPVAPIQKMSEARQPICYLEASVSAPVLAIQEYLDHD